MNVNIYDFQNNKTIVIFDKEIAAVHVVVKSGDEIVTLVDSDGESSTFDANSYSEHPRLVDCFDGEYDLDDPKAIEEWAAYTRERLPVNEPITYDETISYLRGRLFSGRYIGPWSDDLSLFGELWEGNNAN